jgi:hypothetical protein
VGLAGLRELALLEPALAADEFRHEHNRRKVCGPTGRGTANFGKNCAMVRGPFGRPIRRAQGCRSMTFPIKPLRRLKP